MLNELERIIQAAGRSRDDHDHYCDHYCDDDCNDSAINDDKRGDDDHDHGAASPTTTSTLPADYCQVSDLQASVEGTQGAAGTIEVTFRLMNSSPSTCVMWGYPGALSLSQGGTPIATDVKRGGSLSFLNIAVTTVSVPLVGRPISTWATGTFPPAASRRVPPRSRSRSPHRTTPCN